MTSMISKMGKAMQDVDLAPYSVFNPAHTDAIFQIFATAALQALREPTEEMIEAGAATVQQTWDDGSDAMETLPPCDFMPAERTHLALAIWQAMITTAAEGGE